MQAIPVPHRASLVGRERLKGGVSRIHFDVGSAYPTFHAGQYCFLDAGDELIPFSIASTAEDLPTLELHYWPMPGNPQVDKLDRLFDQTALNLSAATGNCWLTAQHMTLPLLLIAAGTGIAQVNAIVRDIIQCGSTPSAVRLYWGVRERDALYLHDEMDRHARAHTWLNYQAVVSHDATFPGRKGWLADAVIADLAPNVARHTLLAGSPAAVYGIIDALQSAGFDLAGAQSDVFDYAPR